MSSSRGRGPALTASGAGLIAVTYGLARFGLGLFGPELRAEFDLTSAGLGTVMSASFGGYVVALASSARFLLQRGPRTVAVSSGLCAVLGTSGVALAPRPGALLVAAAVGGLSTGWASTSLAAAIEAQLPVQRRASGQTVVNAGTSLGLMVAAPAALVAGARWQAAWLAFAAFGVACTLAVSRSVVPAQAPAGEVAEAAVRLSSPRLVATAVVLGASSATFWTFGREQVELVTGMDPATGRLTWLVLGAGGVAGAAVGAAARRHGLTATFAITWSGFAIAHLGLTVGAPPLGALFFVALFGAGYMGLTGLLIVWAVAERPHRPGAAVATAFLILALGQSLGAPLAGWMVDRAGLSVGFAAATVATTFGLLALPHRTTSVATTPIAPPSRARP